MFLGVTAQAKMNTWYLCLGWIICLDLQIHILSGSPYIICSNIQQERIPSWMPALPSNGSPSNNYCIPDYGPANSQHLQCNQPVHLFRRNHASWGHTQRQGVDFIFMKQILVQQNGSETVKFVKQMASFPIRLIWNSSSCELCWRTWSYQSDTEFIRLVRML